MTLVNTSDSVARQNEKLLKITQALMRRVEQGGPHTDVAYAQFERAAMLEAQVKERTTDLQKTLDLLQQTNTRLAQANTSAHDARSNMTEAVESIDEGFALFDASDILVMKNSRFCKDLPDIVADIAPGLPFKDFVELVSQSAYLDLKEGERPRDWLDRRMKRHSDDHVMFNIALTRNRWLQISEHRTASGGTVILQTDVSQIIRVERKAHSKLMNRQAQMVRATLDHLNQGVCIFDRERCLVGWNTPLEDLLDTSVAGAMAGLTFDDLLDRLDGQITFGPIFTRADLHSWAHGIGIREPVTFEVVQNDARTISVFAQQMPDHGFVISFTDVTSERDAASALREMNETLERRVEERTLELEDALAEAERANASKTRFVAAASHDLLQPLSAAKLFTSYLETRASDDITRETAAKAVSALASVEDIIEALLDISKLDSGQAAMNVQDVSLQSILTSLQSELAPMAEAKGLQLSVLSTRLHVKSDPVYLRRILQNLMTNAIRYTTNGRVLVGPRRVGGQVRIDVYDTGLGIARQNQSVIFSEFQRLAPSMSGSKGLGLGLAIVDRACQSLDHKLQIWSEPGQGSRFSVTLEQVHDPAVQPTKPNSAKGEGQPIATDLVVLLVENDEEVASAITLMIEGWDSHVVHAETGEDALALLHEIELTPDRLLLDYQLGNGMTGLDLLTYLRGAYGALPARIISANRTPALVRACSEHNVDLIPKPLHADDLAQFLDASS